MGVVEFDSDESTQRQRALMFTLEYLARWTADLALVVGSSRRNLKNPAAVSKEIRFVADKIDGVIANDEDDTNWCILNYQEGTPIKEQSQ